jgi:hypothetical protein
MSDGGRHAERDPLGPGRGRADPADDGGYDDYHFERRSLAPPSAEVARRRQIITASAAVVAVLGLLVLGWSVLGGGGSDTASSDGASTTAPGSSSDGSSMTTAGGRTDSKTDSKGGKDLTQVPAKATDQFVNPASSGRMWSAKVPGTLTFRGNPTRTYYGRGDVPKAPKVRWFSPKTGGMCASSSVAGQSKVWCGSGWTGQPAVFERDGRTWVVFGAYDKAVHFMDGETGEDILPPFPTGDIIKGSVTVDPDGYPLVYTGSRDNYYRVIAIDRGGAAQELWKLSATAVSPTLWNNDWDGAGLVLDDYLFEGGENSQFHAVKLNRGYSADNKVTVAPELVFNTPGWDQQVINDLAGNRAKEMSIENSVAMTGNTAYFANSGGLVQGWDMGPLRTGGTPTRTFRFWTGDDTDASVVIDPDGFLYVAVEYERSNKRDAEVGQLIKLDPRKPDDPIVWKYDDRGANPAGFWTTPALHDGVVIAPTNGGKVVGLDQQTGAELWSFKLPGPTWQSSVVVDDVLIQGDCNGILHGYDVSDPRTQPPELWNVRIGGCIESTPSVWKGRVYFGTRAGKFFSLGDDGKLESPTASQAGGGGD